MNIVKKAKGFDNTFQFIVVPCPKKGVTQEKACGLLIPQATDTWMGKKEDAAYTLTASYEVFYKIVTGKLGAILGITTRKAKVKGNVAKMLKYTAGTNKLVEIMKTIPTSFEGGFA